MTKKDLKEPKVQMVVNQKIPAQASEGKQKPYVLRDEEVQTVSDIDLSGVYSYANYLRWKIDERLELIKGKVFEMGAPTSYHQRYTGRVYVKLSNFLIQHRCEAFISPFDVRFHDQSREDKDVYTVLQPDVCVICDPAKIDRRGCIGAPDIVVEVLSPSNNKKELFHKFQVYQEHKVREYWIVYPGEQCILQYVLNEDGVLVAGRPIAGENELVSDVLPGFRLNVEELFGPHQTTGDD